MRNQKKEPSDYIKQKVREMGRWGFIRKSSISPDMQHSLLTSGFAMDAPAGFGRAVTNMVLTAAGRKFFKRMAREQQIAA